ncbi:MAG: ABC transporter permease, partial [Geminicoccales bacterium]
MKRADLLELAARNLRESVLRNSLTTLGVAVGVASLVAMLSLGVGLQALADERLNRSGIFDTVVVYSRREIPSFNRAERRALRASSATARRLDPTARAEMAALPNVTEVYPEVRFAIEARFTDRSTARVSSPATDSANSSANAGASSLQPMQSGFATFTTVAGLPLSARENDAFDQMLGTYFTGDSADEAILHADFARDLLGTAGFQPAPSSSAAGDADAGTEQSESVADQPAAPLYPEPPNGGEGQLASLIGQTLTLRYAERVPLAPTPNTPTPEAPVNPERPEGTRGASGNDPASDPSDYGFSVLRREKQMRIVGIIDSEPFGGVRSFARGRVFIPIAVAEQLNALQTSALRDAIRADAAETIYTSLLVRVADPVQVLSVQDAIKQLGFTTWSFLDATRNLRRFFAVLDLFLGIFGSLALAVASLGIINTLVMAILERRREIGIMKALGASDRDIRGLFFAEAGAMGLAGGAAGVALGWAIGQLINFGANVWLARQDLPPEQIWATPWWLIASALAFS